MNKCHCYHLQPKTIYTYHPLTGQSIAHDIEVGVCWGTKECEECSCGGDEAKCNFYPEVRAKAKKELKKNKDKNYVKVVRCKDCDVPHNEWTGCPKLNGLIPSPDFYCAYGKPKAKDK